MTLNTGPWDAVAIRLVRPGRPVSYCDLSSRGEVIDCDEECENDGGLERELTADAAPLDDETVVYLLELDVPTAVDVEWSVVTDGLPRAPVVDERHATDRARFVGGRPESRQVIYGAWTPAEP